MGTNLLNMVERVSSSGVSRALNSGVSSIDLGGTDNRPMHEVSDVSQKTELTSDDYIVMDEILTYLMPM